jgi:two-component system LytT family response regulator
MTLKTVIIDDESNSIDVLKILIDKYCPEIVVEGTACDAETGRRMVAACSPDLVFLDIEMPLNSGFDMLDKIDKKDFQVIFITAYDHYALKAIKYCALDYLLKPVDIDELVEAVHKVSERRHQDKPGDLINVLKEYLKKDIPADKVAIPTVEGLQFVNAREIIRCEATGNYTNMYLIGNRHYLITRSLKEYEGLLSPHNFVRVHNAHLINLNHIEKYMKGEGGYAIMADGSIVDISKRKKRDFLSRFTGEH